MDRELFVDEVPDHFLCAICQDVVKDPIEHMDCDKVFCGPCLERCRDCPICRQPLENKTRGMHRFAKEAYEKLAIRCINAGCGETFPWPKKAQHEDVCAFAPKVKCEHCGFFKISRSPP
jgi:hypothetical protein